MFFIIALIVLLTFLCVLDKFQLFPEAKKVKDTLGLLIVDVFWRYLLCWSAWGFVLYIIAGALLVGSIRALWSLDWETFWACLIISITTYLLSWPFSLLFRLFVRKSREHKTTNRKLNILGLLITIGLFLYPFIKAIIVGDASIIADSIQDDLQHLNNFGSHPESIFTFLILVLLFAIFFGVIFIITEPLQALSTLLVAILLFYLTRKIQMRVKLPDIHTISPPKKEKTKLKNKP